MSNNENILEVTDLKKYFPIKGGMFNKVTGHVKAVDGVTFNLKRGTTMGLVGESGCGKTTTLRLVAGFEFPTSGDIILDGNIKAPGDCEIGTWSEPDVDLSSNHQIVEY